MTDMPNIVYILVDNFGWGDVSVQGGSVATPRIDQLAGEGLRMTNFNVESQCTPTRSAILTGRLPIRSGTNRVTYGQPYGLAPWEFTLTEMLSDAGYRTAMFGKWHLGDIEGRLPTDQGFDQWYGIKNTSDEAGYSSTPQFDPDVFPVPHIWEAMKGSPATKVKEFDLESRKTIDRELIERAEEFISSASDHDAPYFVYLPLTQIHPPLGHHPDFDNVSGTGIYGDILTELDHNVGRVLDALEAAGASDDTIVILTGDNGAVTEGIGGGSNGPFRGGFTGYEAGLRTVGIVRWPARIEAGRVSNEIVAALDWLPTVAALTGLQDKIPTDRPIDGVDQSDFFLGNQDESNRDHIVYYVGDDLFAVKWRSFKVHMKTVDDLWAPVQEHLFPPIYDVVNDPGEDNNLMKMSLFSHSWVYAAIGELLHEHAMSMHEYPNIQPGELFEGYKLTP